MKYIGELDSGISEIEVVENPDGSFRSMKEADAFFVESVNMVMEIFRKECKNFIEYIKKDVFDNKTITSQELVITNNKVLAVCDYSTKDVVVELKTYGIFDYDGNVKEKILKQLYYQNKGRKMYVLTTNHDRITMFDKSINIQLYEITFE